MAFQSAIQSYPIHFITTVSNILSTFFSTILTILGVFFNTILPFATAVLKIPALVFSCLVLCIVFAERLGYDPSGATEKEKTRKQKKMQGQGIRQDGIKGDRNQWGSFSNIWFNLGSQSEVLSLQPL